MDQPSSDAASNDKAQVEVQLRAKSEPNKIAYLGDTAKFKLVLFKKDHHENVSPQYPANLYFTSAFQALEKQSIFTPLI